MRCLRTGTRISSFKAVSEGTLRISRIGCTTVPWDSGVWRMPRTTRASRTIRASRAPGATVRARLSVRTTECTSSRSRSPCSVAVRTRLWDSSAAPSNRPGSWTPRHSDTASGPFLPADRFHWARTATSFSPAPAAATRPRQQSRSIPRPPARSSP